MCVTQDLFDEISCVCVSGLMTTGLMGTSCDKGSAETLCVRQI